MIMYVFFTILFDCCTHYSVTYHLQRILVTVQTSFNADRLDLGRVGKLPNPEFLCTEAAREPKTIEWANQRSLNGFVPDNMLGRSFSGS